MSTTEREREFLCTTDLPPTLNLIMVINHSFTTVKLFEICFFKLKLMLTEMIAALVPEMHFQLICYTCI